MQSNLQKKIDYENFDYKHYDAHIKEYESQKLGIEVVMCNTSGIPETHKIQPMSSYLEHKVYNI
jgi:hypothetical protein